MKKKKKNQQAAASIAYEKSMKIRKIIISTANKHREK